MSTRASNSRQTGYRCRLRGQSEVLSVVLVFGMVLLGAAAVIGLGSTAIGGTESQLSDDRAEKTLTQLDSKAGLVALGEANSQRIPLPTEAGEQYRVAEDEGNMQITVTNLSDEDDSFEVMDTTLGAVVYENGDSRIAYQGGGVFRATKSGGTMISPPEFHYRAGTLTLPAISVVGDDSLGSSATIRQDTEERKFPLPGQADRLNPLDNHRVDVTVQSEYYRGWGQYFVERTDGSVEYDHDNQEVTVTLVTPIGVNEITAASASLSAGGEFAVSGTSALDCGGIEDEDDVFTSSFNSSTGEGYCEQFEDNGDPLHDRLPGTKGDIVYGKDVDISDGSGGSNFYGDVTSGMTVTIDDSEGSGQPDVYGNISYVDNCLTNNESTDCSQRIHDDSDGEVMEIDRIQLTESIDWFIDTSIEAMADDHDESYQNVDEIENDVLEAGTYYFESFDMGDGDQLELDTSDGIIALAVDGDVTMDEAQISVVGDEHVELYVGGDTDDGNLIMENGAEITAKNDNGTQFRTYGKADFDARMGGGGGGNLAKYTGVIYAPPGSAGEGTVSLDGAMVFGGILTGQTSVEGGSIHYDEALEGKRVVPDDARIIRVTYLHVTENTVKIE